MALSNATSKLKEESANEFSSRAEYLVQKEKEKAERDALGQRFTQFEPPTEKEKAKKDNGPEGTMKEISSSLKTIQSILKGISTNSEKHLRAISKKLDRSKGEQQHQQVQTAVRPITQAVDASTTKEKIIATKYLLETAKWQATVTDLLKKILHKKSVPLASRRTSKPKSSGGILSTIAKVIGGILLATGAGSFMSGLVGGISTTIKSVLKGVGNAILDVGKIAVVALANGAGKVMDKIATMISGLGRSIMDGMSSMLSKLTNAATEFLSNTAKKGVSLAKDATKYVVDHAKEAGKTALGAGKDALKTYALPAAKTIAMVAIGAKGAQLAAKGAKKIIIGAGKAVARKVPEIAKKAGSAVKNGGSSAGKRILRTVGKAARVGSIYGGAAWDTAKDIAKSSNAGKAIAKIGSKVGTKTLFKTILKKMPLGIGAAVGLGYAANRAMHGDYTGAGIEAGSAAASIIPGAGTAASIAGEVALAKHDSDLEKRLQVQKTVVAPITNHLEASQKRNEEIKAIKDQKRTQAPEPQASVTTNNIQNGNNNVAPRIHSRNNDTTMDFFRKITIFGAFSGHGHVVG